jgi:hypothetical protein
MGMLGLTRISPANHANLLADNVSTPLHGSLHILRELLRIKRLAGQLVILRARLVITLIFQRLCFLVPSAGLGATFASRRLGRLALPLGPHHGHVSASIFILPASAIIDTLRERALRFADALRDM